MRDCILSNSGGDSFFQNSPMLPDHSPCQGIERGTYLSCSHTPCTEGIMSNVADLLTEDLIPLPKVAAQFPGTRGATRINPATVYRWCTRGSRTPDGRVVRLEHVRVGSRVLTSREAVGRYVAALSSSVAPTVTAVRTPTVRNRSSEAAAAALRELGA